jgi:molybdopterin converting factor small subunit
MASRLGTSVLREALKKGSREIAEGVTSKELENRLNKITRDTFEKGKKTKNMINQYANQNYDSLNKSVTSHPDTYLGGKKRRQTRIQRKTRRRKTKRNRNN